MLDGTENFQEFDPIYLDGCGYEKDGKNLAAWDKEVHPGFGAYMDQMGTLEIPNLPVAVDHYDDLGDGTVRTPMMELGAEDFQYMQKMGKPYDGMKAVSDMGDLYQWSTMDGLFSRIKRGFRKVRKRIRKGRKRIRKVMAKTKFGRVLIKVGKGIKKVAMKVVLPLAKVVGKWAPRLAPIAMLIPGVGPLIAGGMLAAGGVAKVINKYGAYIKKVAVVDQKTGKKSVTYKLKTKNKEIREKIKKELASESKKYKKMPKKRLKKLVSTLKKRNPEAHSKRVKGLSKKSKAAANRLSQLARIEKTRDKMVAAKKHMQRQNTAMQKNLNAQRQQMVALAKQMSAQKAAMQQETAQVKQLVASQAARQISEPVDNSIKSQQIRAYLAAARALGWKG